PPRSSGLAGGAGRGPHPGRARPGAQGPARRARPRPGRALRLAADGRGDRVGLRGARGLTMRIFFLDYSHEAGLAADAGGFRKLWELAAAFARAGHDARVLYPALP